MALQAASPVDPISPQVIGSAFVHQYYLILHRSPDQIHKFYQDQSTMTRPDANDVMVTVSTMQGIDEKISSLDFSNYFTEIESIDTQLSYKDGVFIVVTGFLIAPDNGHRNFTQSFFLAPQESGGYFVLNDVFRYISEKQISEIAQVAVIHANESTRVPMASSISESELPPAKEPQVVELPAALTEKATENGDQETGSSVDKSSRVEGIVNADPSVQVTKEIKEAQKAAAPATQKDEPKKSYASIVAKDNPLPAQVKTVSKAKSTMAKSVTKTSENVEKQAAAAAKSAPSTETPPSGGDVSENLRDERGYSVYLGNLPTDMTEAKIREEFKKFGPIKQNGVQVRGRQYDNLPRFGFVEFESNEAMQAAIEASPIDLGGRKVGVEEKRTTTRFVNGVILPRNDRYEGPRFQSERGGFRGGDNFRGREGYVNNAGYNRNDYRNNRGDDYYRNNNRDDNDYRNNNRGDDHRNNRGDNDYRSNNRGDYSGRGRALPVRDMDGYRNGNGYQSGNGYQQRGGYKNVGTGGRQYNRSNGPPRQEPSGSA